MWLGPKRHRLNRHLWLCGVCIHRLSHKRDCALPRFSKRSIVLEIKTFCEELAEPTLEPYEAMILPRRFLLNVIQLYREILIRQCTNQRLNSRCVVVPPASVHIRSILQSDVSTAVSTAGRCSESIQLNECGAHAELQSL